MTKWFTSDWHLGHKTIFDFCEDRRTFLTLGPGGWQYKQGSWQIIESEATQLKTLDGLTVMADHFIQATREAVQPEDEIYFLGDMAFTGPERQRFLEFVDDLNCSKKVLVSGNHDKTWKKHNQKETEVFDEVYIRGDLSVVNIKDQIFYLSHLPAEGHMDERDWTYEIQSERVGNPPLKGTYLPEHDMYPIICGHMHDKWRVWHNPKEECWQYNCGVDVNNFKPVSEDVIFQAWQTRHVKE